LTTLYMWSQIIHYLYLFIPLPETMWVLSKQIIMRLNIRGRNTGHSKRY